MVASGEPACASASSSACSRSAPATTTRCLPVRLASSSARSARCSSSSADSGSSHRASPIEQRIGVAAAIRSATDAAARRVGAGQQHDELVAAVAADHVVVAQLAAQRGGDQAQLLVAGLVAPIVVDRLEVVEVEQQADERRVLAAGARDLLAHADVQRAVVGQAGEGVGGGRHAGLLVGLGVAAGHDRERGDRLERAQVVGRHPAHLGEADRQRALELAVPDHRDARGGLDPAEGCVGGLDLGLVRVGHERLAGGQHPPGDALAAAAARSRSSPRGELWPAVATPPPEPSAR